MRVRFVLTMDNVILEEKLIDQVVIGWEDNLDQQEILEVSNKWINSRNFLTNRIIDLNRVGESQLTIELLEELDDDDFMDDFDPPLE